MTANEEDAADLTQEAFLRVWQKLPEFRLQAAFSTWLYRLTTNLCLDFMRGRKRRPTVPLEREDEEQTPLPEPKDPAPTPEEAALAAAAPCAGRAFAGAAGAVGAARRARPELCADRRAARRSGGNGQIQTRAGARGAAKKARVRGELLPMKRVISMKGGCGDAM